MSPSELRSITASEDIAAAIDRGAEIDKEIKKLSKEGDGIKSKIVVRSSSNIRDDEVSIRIEGAKSVATLTASESMSIDAGAEKYPVLKKAIDKGFLQNVVEEKKGLVVPPDDSERAAQVLKEAGIEATVTNSVSVKAVDVRKMNQNTPESSEHAEAQEALKSCLSVKTTHRVKYETREGIKDE